jgi:hypothetical protein
VDSVSPHPNNLKNNCHAFNDSFCLSLTYHPGLQYAGDSVTSHPMNKEETERHEVPLGLLAGAHPVHRSPILSSGRHWMLHHNLQARGPRGEISGTVRLPGRAVDSCRGVTSWRMRMRGVVEGSCWQIGVYVTSSLHPRPLR